MKLQPVRLIGPELTAGEQIRWLGTPGLSTILLEAALPLLFGIVFSVQAVRSTITATMEANAAEFVFNVFGMMIGFIFGCSALVGVCAAGQTAYAVTDRRILIVTWMLGKRVQSIDPRWINTLEHKVRADGTGSVFFRIDDVNGLEASGTQTSGFRGVSDVLGAVLALNQLRDTQGVSR